MRIVGTLTTMPHRYPMLWRTLQCLTQQTYPLDAIYLGLPKISKRSKIEYPPVPDFIRDLCTIVELSEDYGPISKIMGALLTIPADEDTIIISFDDDVIYPPTLVAAMVAVVTERSCVECALGGSGFVIGASYPFYGSMVNAPSEALLDINRIVNLNSNREVDILCGFAGVMYHRQFFANDFLTLIQEKFSTNENLFLNDDVTISGYLSFKGIKRKIMPFPGPLSEQMACKVFPTLAEQILNATQGYQANLNISYDKIKFLQRFSAAIEESKQIGFFASPAVMGYNDSVLYKIFLLVILLIIFIFLVYMASRDMIKF